MPLVNLVLKIMDLVILALDVLLSLVYHNDRFLIFRMQYLQVFLELLHSILRVCGINENSRKIMRREIAGIVFAHNAYACPFPVCGT